MPIDIDLSGKRFGKLTIFSFVGYIKKKKVLICKYDCGEIVTILGDSLGSGRTKSCGCLRKKKGIDRPNFKHGEKRSRLYEIWSGMKKKMF